MGFKQPASVPEIVTQLRHIARECSSPYNDGYISFELKKDLYLIKDILDNLIEQCPSFAGEEEWLTNREKERIVNYLKK